jgi:hypothetical protein
LIPDNISHDHIIKALKQIDEEGIPSHRKSIKHNLIHEGKQYPPKLVLSKANIYTFWVMAIHPRLSDTLYHHTEKLQ